MPQRPHDVAGETGGDGDGEDAALAVAAVGTAAAAVGRVEHDRRKRGRLPAVELLRLNEIVRAERNLDDLLPIQVGVAERERGRAVRIRVEAVEERRHPELDVRLGTERPLLRLPLGAKRRRADEERYRKAADEPS